VDGGDRAHDVSRVVDGFAELEGQIVVGRTVDACVRVVS